MKWFDIPKELIPKLRELQAQDLPDSEIKSEDAVMMFAGLGDPIYLTFDGRIIILDMLDDIPPREAQTFQEATSAIVIGAKVRKYPELLQLLPSRSTGATDCEKCEKSGWWKISENITIICDECGGLGWLTEK